MARDSMVFYRSFYEAIETLSEKERLKIFEAIIDYGLNRNEQKLSGIQNTVFLLIKPQLDSNWTKYENGTKPKQKKSKSEAKQKQNESEIDANDERNLANVNVNVNVNDNVNENVNVNVCLANIEQYIKQKNYHFSAQEFFDYYDKWNWKLKDGTPINWQRQCDIWEKKELEKGVVVENDTPDDYWDE